MTHCNGVTVKRNRVVDTVGRHCLGIVQYSSYRFVIVITVSGHFTVVIVLRHCDGVIVYRRCCIVTVVRCCDCVTVHLHRVLLSCETL